MGYVCQDDRRTLQGLGILEIMWRKQRKRKGRLKEKLKKQTDENIAAMTKQANRLEAAKAAVLAAQEAEAIAAENAPAEYDWPTLGFGAAAALVATWFLFGR